MTWSAQFKVTEVSDGPAPIEVVAEAHVEDGSLVQNTERASSLELRAYIDAEQTSIKVGDTITGSGSFSS